MSKLSFRARALDASKPMPIYMSEELPDLPDYSAINRAVPQMPSGMEKEEECEHHLQRAICTGLIIPTPEVADLTDVEAYDRIYPTDYKLPRQLIHMQPFAMEQDIPDYDMDSEDEKWVNSQAKKMDLTPLKFEEMMDRLEKGSGQTVVTLQEAKSLLKEDDDLIIAVYDYWLNKRLKTQHPLIPMVKTEHRLGSAANNPYLAFRRRTEKMQTRKNRKNDEASYEKMLKLRRDLSRAVTLLELVKRREKTKREHLHLTIEIYEKRYQAGDFSGQLLAEVSALKTPRPAFAPLFTNQFGINHQNWVSKVSGKDDGVPRKEKRQYKKRKHKVGTVGGPHGHGRVSGSGGSDLMGYSCPPGGELLSSEDEGDVLHGQSVQSEEEEPDANEGPFAFRRKKHCSYHAPLPGLGNWPWCSREEGGLADRRYRYCLTSIAHPRKRCVGFARRRVGRGGRVILDRATTSLDEVFSSLDFTVMDSAADSQNKDHFVNEIRNEWLHFRPKTPPPCADSDGEDGEVDVFNISREEQPLHGIPGLEGDSLTLEVETLSDNIFVTPSSPTSQLEGAGSNVSTTELNLSDILSSSPSEQLFDFPSSLTDSVSLEVLERLGLMPEDSEETKSVVNTEESPRKLSSPSALNSEPLIGCSKFSLQPSSNFRFNGPASDPFVFTPPSSVASRGASVVNHHVSSSSSQSSLPHQSSHHHSHHHHRRRHRHHPLTPTSNSSASPCTSANANNVANMSDNSGVLVVNHDLSTSASVAFMPQLASASDNMLARSTGAPTGFAAANNLSTQTLTNGPVSTEYPSTSRSRPTIHTSRNHQLQQQHTVNSCYASTLSSPSLSSSLGHHPSTFPPPASVTLSPGQHKAYLASQLRGLQQQQQQQQRFSIARSLPTTPAATVVTSATATSATPTTVTIKQEPMEVTLNSGETLEGDVANNKEKASNQVCVDKKQLVRKNNSLPMEVT